MSKLVPKTLTKALQTVFMVEAGEIHGLTPRVTKPTKSLLLKIKVVWLISLNVSIPLTRSNDKMTTRCQCKSVKFNLMVNMNTDMH